MNMAGTNLSESLKVDFGLACTDLAEARQAVRVKDTPAARARIIACTATLDAILDLTNAGALASV
jgi:hypothetical protein